MKKLRYGIIGCGGISPKHLDGYSACSDEVEIVAACDINEKRLKEACEKYKIPKRYLDYHQLLNDPDIDFVSVCLPNNLHAPVTVEALRKGKHVHCEKPMAMNENEAKEMIRARDESGKQLMIGLNNRFTPFAQYAKQLVDSGLLGDIYFAKCGWQRRGGLPHSGWFGDPKISGGGALIDLGVHYIDLAMYMMGFPEVQSVLARTYQKFGGSPYAKLYTYEPQKIEEDVIVNVDDLASGFITCKNGASIFFEVSWASNIEKEKVFLELYGDKAGLRFENDFEQKIVKMYTVVNGQFCDLEPKLDPFVYSETEFRHFIGSMRSGKEPRMAPPKQGQQMMRLIDNIYRSSREDRGINFEEF